MRLIDADKVREYIAFDGDILIDDMPTIEAIPIDWIRKEQNSLLKSNVKENIKYSEWINGMIYRWRKENERI